MSELWYKKEAQTWEEALPIGNGRIGGMVFASPVYDRITLNEETLWSGNVCRRDIFYSKEKLEEIRRHIRTHDYLCADKMISDMMQGETTQKYLCWGDIQLTMQNPQHGDIKCYRRSLSLDNAVCESEFRISNKNFGRDVIYKKEYFTSFSEDCMIVHITADYDWLMMSARIDPLVNCTVSYADDTVTALGNCEKDGSGIPFELKMKIMTDGTIDNAGNSIDISRASDVTCIISISTGFNGYDKNPLTNGKDYVAECQSKLDNAVKYTYEQLKQKHISAYKKMYGRVELNIDGEDYSDIPTDERITEAGKGRTDNKLVQTLFDYGRYLLISSSQPGGQPANLQGIWSKNLNPTWKSNYTTNINLQMNYWHAEIVDLPECAQPLVEMIKELSQIPNHYGMRGWLCCHNSDIWRFNREATKGVYAYWQVGGIWLCRHIYEHYIHTRDIEFLKDYMPILRGAYEFLEDFLVKWDDGKLTTSPSVSPENYYIYNGQKVAASHGSTMDLSIISDFLMNMCELCGELGEDPLDYKNMLENLEEIKIGHDGRIMEWCAEFEESDPGHRHISHLYGIYPGKNITDKKMYDAAKKSLKRRMENGGGHTGWSNAWIACVYARFGEGEKVMEHIRNMFKKSIYPNMFDAHPPFQIDGNFGIAAAICESLMQSHTGEVKLIPAIPKEWKAGYVKGFVTATGEKISFQWKDGKAWRL